MIPAEVYTERRKKLMKLLGTGVIVIPPNPKMKYSQDKYFKYRPNSNIFYLSGMIQEDTIIVLDNISKKSYLFLTCSIISGLGIEALAEGVNPN